jgi:4-hydroxy-3-methylbut-2-en-1-yl diphosphate synthase IspG/GcpE
MTLPKKNCPLIDSLPANTIRVVRCPQCGREYNSLYPHQCKTIKEINAEMRAKLKALKPREESGG